MISNAASPEQPDNPTLILLHCLFTIFRFDCQLTRPSTRGPAGLKGKHPQLPWKQPSHTPHMEESVISWCNATARFSSLVKTIWNKESTEAWKCGNMFPSKSWARGCVKKYINIPSEKYIYMYMYMCIYVYIHTYVKWMSTSLMLACLKNGWAPVLCWLVLKMDEYRSYAGLS